MIPNDILEVFETVINPLLADHGGCVYPLDYQDGVVTVRMGGACRGCLSLDATVNNYIKKELQNRCHKNKVLDVVVSDEVDPELWELAKKILNGGKLS